MYRLCIFDLDGTLLDTVSALTYSTNLTLEAFGLGPLVPDQIKKLVGDGYKKQIERALKACGDENLVHYEKALTLYMENFAKFCMKDVAPYDGIVSLLNYLKKKGIKMAVFSNKPHHQAVQNIEVFFGKDYFDCVRGEQPSIPKKPAPDGALLICKELGVKAEECLYLGDTNTDMKTGISAGMDTVGVTWGFRDRNELLSFSPRYLVDAPSQVEQIVEEAYAHK